MHLDYRGGTQHKAIISADLTTRHCSLHCCPKKRLVLLYSVAMWHFGYSHLHCLCVCMFFLSALEWHGILLACWSVVNSNVNGLAGNSLSEDWEERKDGRKEFGDYEEERQGYELGFGAAAVPPTQ